MSKFMDILEALDIERENDLILEFANIEPYEHNLGIDVVMHIMQPGDKKLKHGPRAKFFSHGSKEEFCVSINDHPKFIGNYRALISERDANKLLQEIVIFKIPFLNFWYDSRMTTGMLAKEMSQVRSGQPVTPTYLDKINQKYKKKKR